MAEAIKLKIDTGIKNIAIEDEDGKLLTTLKINTTDATTSERFLSMVQEIKDSAAKYEKSIKDVKVENDPDGFAEFAEKNRIRVQYQLEYVEKINRLFGENTVQNIYRECYEANPDYIPDESALLAIVEVITPIMGKLYAERSLNNQKKYNVNKMGANSIEMQGHKRKRKNKQYRPYRQNQENMSANQ